MKPASQEPNLKAWVVQSQQWIYLESYHGLNFSEPQFPNLWNGDEKPLAAWTRYRSMWEVVLGSPSRTHNVDSAARFLSVLSQPVPSVKTWMRGAWVYSTPKAELSRFSALSSCLWVPPMTAWDWRHSTVSRVGWLCWTEAELQKQFTYLKIGCLNSQLWHFLVTEYKLILSKWSVLNTVIIWIWTLS